ncbi:hypothetical protein LTR66_006844 [Elasticomyces elasticus]|nr:hypothetical protein LTR66_006844 [Elasticomyces elasticus]
MSFAMSKKRSLDQVDTSEAMPFAKEGRYSMLIFSRVQKSRQTSLPHGSTFTSFRRDTTQRMHEAAPSTLSEPGSPQDIDMDVSSSDNDDDDDDDHSPAPSFSHSPEAHFPTTRPSSFQPRPSRKPTPIHPPSYTTTSLRRSTRPLSANPPTATQQQQQQPRDRLPSPISEDEPPTPTHPSLLPMSSQLSLLSVHSASPTSPSSPTSASSSTTTAAVKLPDDVEMQTPPLVVVVKKQRARSGAMQGQLRRFSMGYRDDCEKCRMRVPGHMSHFVVV